MSHRPRPGPKPAGHRPEQPTTDLRGRDLTATSGFVVEGQLLLTDQDTCAAAGDTGRWIAGETVEVRE